MRVVTPSVEVIKNIEVPPYTMIERVGRICYKSEDLITEDSAPKFVRAMYKNGHHAMLEHSHILINFDIIGINSFLSTIAKYSGNSSINLTEFLNITNISRLGRTFCFVSASIRAWIEVLSHIKGDELFCNIGHLFYSKYPELFSSYENTTDYVHCSIWGWEEFIAYVNGNDILSEIEKSNILMNHLPITAIFTCDLLCHREFVRHRKASFAGESTRYCNYCKDKFGNEISVIDPFYDDPMVTGEIFNEWYGQCLSAEKSYFKLLGLGEPPEIARSVLPVSTKSDLAITCTESEWQHILDLRYHGTTGRPHPQIKSLMKMAYPLLREYSDNRLH